MPDQFRPLRTGTHRSGNIYFADTPEGVDDDAGQLGYIRDGAYARAMVATFNAALAVTSGVQDGPKHQWLSGVSGKTPVLRCLYCPIIWWPDRNEPKSACGGQP